MAEDVVRNEELATVEFDPNKVYAQLTEENGVYFVTDDTHGSQECKFDKTGDWILMPKNDSNRQCMALGKAKKEIDENGKVDLFYKVSRPIGSTGARVPNAKLISYLSEEDQAEYNAIIERAKAAKAADKKQPMTELEKLEKKRDKILAAIEQLNEEIASMEAKED